MSALHMDWLNAMSVVALGITTAMRSGAADRPRRQHDAQNTRDQKPSCPHVLLLFQIMRTQCEAADGRALSTDLRSALAPFERLVQRRRLPHAVDRHSQGGDGQHVGEHDRDA